MDCSCWKEKTGNALRLGVQAGPEQNEWNQGSNQTFGHCVWLPLGEHRALCSSVAVDIFFLASCALLAVVCLFDRCQESLFWTRLCSIVMVCEVRLTNHHILILKSPSCGGFRPYCINSHFYPLQVCPWLPVHIHRTTAFVRSFSSIARPLFLSFPAFFVVVSLLSVAVFTFKARRNPC